MLQFNGKIKEKKYIKTQHNIVSEQTSLSIHCWARHTSVTAWRTSAGELYPSRQVDLILVC